ncbi:hypothetical protein J5259_002358 [Klebsiella oxytoca]|nr:hypothetical protein [Klebsiella oxytoca]
MLAPAAIPDVHIRGPMAAFADTHAKLWAFIVLNSDVLQDIKADRLHRPHRNKEQKQERGVALARRTVGGAGGNQRHQQCQTEKEDAGEERVGAVDNIIRTEVSLFNNLDALIEANDKKNEAKASCVDSLSERHGAAFALVLAFHRRFLPWNFAEVCPISLWFVHLFVLMADLFFTNNRQSIMKLSYNFAFVSDGSQTLCYNLASFFGWIAFSHGFGY